MLLLPVRAGTGPCVPPHSCPPSSAACPAWLALGHCPCSGTRTRLSHSPHARALPTCRGSHAHPRLGWLLGAARQQPAVPPLSRAHAECVSRHACTPAVRGCGPCTATQVLQPQLLGTPGLPGVGGTRAHGHSWSVAQAQGSPLLRPDSLLGGPSSRMRGWGSLWHDKAPHGALGNPPQ